MPPSILDLVDRALLDVEPIVGDVRPEHYGRPTPCAGFDVRSLTAHLIGGIRATATVAEGGEMRFDDHPDLDHEDATAEYTAAADRLRAAWAPEGMLEREFQVPWGKASGLQIIGFLFVEVLQHGWDLARGLGRDRTIDDELAAAALASATMWVDDSVRTPQMFGPEVPIDDDAPAPDRLAAFLGRQP
jgi:uncharacterized protein (TIGR03086 family)